MPSPDAKTPVVVLGAGIVGICTALSLLERGVAVTLIDKGEPGQETSMGNAGVISPWSIIPQSLPGTWKSIPKLMFGGSRPLSIHPRIALQMIPWGIQFLRNGTEDKVRRTAEAMSHLCGPSIELYQKHLRGTGEEYLIADSMYVHAFRDGSRANLNAIDYRIRSALGADLELVGKDRLAEIEPALSQDFSASILIKGQARVRSPGRLAAVLAEKARSMGAVFRRATIKQIRRVEADKWQVECEGEDLQAERIVLCMGAWTSGLLKGLGVPAPLMAERGYHVEFKNSGVEINNSIMDVDAKVVASSMEGGIRIAGQAEFAPVDAPPNKHRQAQLTRVAQTAFPALKVEDANFWMGRRPSFPDSLPAIGEVKGHSNLFANFGHSHYGLMMSPRSGEIIAQLLCKEHQNLPLDEYSLSRF